ncbi:zinc ribbon-containing protein, partial [Campylobacter jejuni]|nr:zinc ribbon-containing protein [Campylobacter jejuni]
SGGEFECVDCKRKITISSSDSLPPCPNFRKEPDKHKLKGWKNLTGRGDAKEDPYP